MNLPSPTPPLSLVPSDAEDDDDSDFEAPPKNKIPQYYQPSYSSKYYPEPLRRTKATQRKRVTQKISGWL
jgi:hypothetical protein